MSARNCGFADSKKLVKHVAMVKHAARRVAFGLVNHARQSVKQLFIALNRGFIAEFHGVAKRDQLEDSFFLGNSLTTARVKNVVDLESMANSGLTLPPRSCSVWVNILQTLTTIR